MPAQLQQQPALGCKWFKQQAWEIRAHSCSCLGCSVPCHPHAGLLIHPEYFILRQVTQHGATKAAMKTVPQSSEIARKPAGSCPLHTQHPPFPGLVLGPGTEYFCTCSHIRQGWLIHAENGHWGRVLMSWLCSTAADVHVRAGTSTRLWLCLLATISCTHHCCLR